LVVRVYECANRRGQFSLKLGVRAREVVEVNLLEEALVRQNLALDPQGGSVRGYIKPYEIKTFLLRF
jgi:hypothetical protein